MLRALAVVAGLLVVAGGCGSDPSDQPPTTATVGTRPLADGEAAAICARTGVELLGDVANDDLLEASGLVASRAHPGVFWSHNDSGDGGVFAIGADGADLGFFPLAGHEIIDLEDIAIAAAGDGFDLFLADIGDNLEQRDSIRIYRFAEPDPTTPAPLDGVEVLEFVYPDRPHNAETLLIDEAADQLVIVTKEQVAQSDPPEGTGPTAPSVVFEGTFEGHGDGPVQLVEAATIDTPELETRTEGFHPLSILGFGGVATGGDVAPDGSLVAIRTYETVWLWPRQVGQTVAEAFTSEPCEVTTALEVQGEALAFVGDRLVTVGEGAHPPLNQLAG